MRTLAALLIALISGVALAVALFAGLHVLRTPSPETAPPGAGRIDMPAPLTIAPDPFDRTPRQLTRVADANHKRRLTLRGQAGTDAHGRLVSIWRQDVSGAPLAIERIGTDGTFAFGELRAGTYVVRGHGGNEVEVRLDADVEVDLRPKAPAPRTLTLAVDLAAGPQPLAKAMILFERDGSFLTQGQTDSAGRVSLDGLHGKLAYRVWAGLPDDVGNVREWQGETEAPSDGSDWTIRLRAQDAR